MISKKLSLNKVCIILATTILLLSVVMFSVLYILTKEMSVVFCSMAFCLLFLLCVTVFVILIRRKLTLFSEILCCTLDEMMNGKIDISQVAEEENLFYKINHRLVRLYEVMQESNYNKDAEGNPLVQLYGADDFLLNSMDVIEGTIDWEALKSGNHVLYALTADDNGNIIDDPNIHVGDTLHFNHVQMNGLSSSIDNSFDCKVMAKVLINENTDTIRSTGFAKFYMPTDVFLPLCEQPHLVSFPFNVVDGMEADMEEFLSSYVEDIEPSMNYDSKQTYINSFNDLTSLIITIGGALSIIIGLIGITNFVNSVLTSIITRRKELAMLQSIGMTGKQLKKMLSFEGLYYAAGTVVASIVFGSLVSVIIVRAISNSIWFFTYKFVIFPMFVIYPFLIALTVIIPAIIYRKIAKTSIIERLHQN